MNFLDTVDHQDYLSLINKELQFTGNKEFISYYGIRPYKLRDKSFFNFSINNNLIFNSGHPNIDNNAEYHAGTGQNVFNSFRLDYYNKWFFLLMTNL